MLPNWALILGILCFAALVVKEGLEGSRAGGESRLRGTAVTLEAISDEEKKALRLAKAMVSDLYAYYEKEIIKGRASRCLYSLIGSKLEKCLETYASNVDPKCRKLRYLETLLIEDIAQGRIEVFGNPEFVGRINQK